MIITLLRKYRKDHTDGRVFIDGSEFCQSLEDTGRPPGIKISSETCIPEGAYKVAISHSNKFKRDMLIIYNIDDDHSVERTGVRFTGIRSHGGNNKDHTAGCIIVARNSNESGRVWGSMESELFREVKKAIDSDQKVLLVISIDVE